MASFRLMHRATGVVLSGYVVLSATPQEIENANSNLSRNGSSYRYIETATPAQAAVAEAAAESIAHAA
jgi:hypothetical protein